MKEAESVNHASGSHPGGLLIGPNQINITQVPGHKAHQPVKVPTREQPVTVNL